MDNLDIPQLKAIIAEKGYKWFDNQPNLIGIRRTGNAVTDKFQDMFYIVWKQPEISGFAALDVKGQQKALNHWLYTGKDQAPLKIDGDKGANTVHAIAQYTNSVGQYRMRSMKGTTVPGKPAFLDPSHKDGVMIIIPGQYIDVYESGFHKHDKTHPALRQVGIFRHWRDNDGDLVIDKSVVYASKDNGANFHRAKLEGDTPLVGPNSEGCQVAQNRAKHLGFIRIFSNYDAMGIERFTYTLVEEEDV
jgi:hypothetical protein